MKKLILLILFTVSLQAQTITPYIGYRALELDFKIEKTLIYGVGVSIVDADLVAKRATKNDGAFKVHNANTDLVPSLFFLIGANFDGFQIIGKLGGAYFNQMINNEQEVQKIYRSVGVQVGYRKILISFDSSNSLMVGYNFKLR
jgi:hypothetical protein